MSQCQQVGRYLYVKGGFSSKRNSYLNSFCASILSRYAWSSALIYFNSQSYRNIFVTLSSIPGQSVSFLVFGVFFHWQEILCVLIAVLPHFPSTIPELSWLFHLQFLFEVQLSGYVDKERLSKKTEVLFSLYSSAIQSAAASQTFEEGRSNMVKFVFSCLWKYQKW